MDNKFLSIDKNICFGLAFLLWPVALLTLIIDRHHMSAFERQQCISVLVGNVISRTPFIGWIYGIVFLVFAIIAAVKSFKHDYTTRIPLAFDVARIFVHKLPHD